MAEQKQGAGNPVPYEGDHDRVGMLSLNKDGSPDQHNPEIIGDKEASVRATKEQFAQQAVSAVDVEKRGASSSAGGEELKQDPEIAALQKDHEKAVKAAESAAEKVVDSLYQD